MDESIDRAALSATQPAQAAQSDWGAQQFKAPVYPPDGTESPFTVINLGSGKVQMGDSIHDGRLPALWFGINGQGMGHEETMNREARPGETLAVVTFANVEGLDVLLDVIQRIRREKFPEAQAAQGEPAEHWHRLYLEKCQQYNDRVAQLGGVIEALDAEAAQGAGEVVAELKRLASVCPELNLNNYGPDDVDELNAWAVEVAQAIDQLSDTQPAAGADVEPEHVTLLNEKVRELEARDAFEAQNKCSHGFKRSARGTYVNPPVARDWKWFQLGIQHATKDTA